MEISEILQDINQNLDTWEAAIPAYTDEELAKNPDEQSWSIGQVYIHVLNAGIHFFPRMVKKCLESDEGADKVKNSYGDKAFQYNSFPPIEIKLPSGTPPPYPKNKEELSNKISQLREVSADLAQQLTDNPGSGKQNHGGFGFLDAKEWFQTNAMHVRHHLRQKEKLDKFLEKIS